jgi:hypothetical protein
MKIEKPIVLTEFPKSGGSWIVSLLGDALCVPQRDIYVRPCFNLFDIKKHPWYASASDLDFPVQSVIKSHELPGSGLIDFDATYIHLIRDGRDVAVSKWFFENEFLVQNNITSPVQYDFEEYIEKTARDWSNYVEAWGRESVPTIRYEMFLTYPIQSLEGVLNAIGKCDVSRQALERTISKFTKENFGASLGNVFKHNTFVRKGVAGDWRNYFSKNSVAAFKATAGEALLTLGYELNSDWSI